MITCHAIQRFRERIAYIEPDDGIRAVMMADLSESDGFPLTAKQASKRTTYVCTDLARYIFDRGVMVTVLEAA